MHFRVIVQIDEGSAPRHLQEVADEKRRIDIGKRSSIAISFRGRQATIFSPTASAWPNWAVSPLFPLPTTLVHWVDSLPPDTDLQISPPVHPHPGKPSIQTFPCAPFLLPTNHKFLAGIFTLLQEALPSRPATLSVDPWRPSRGSHFRSLPSTHP